MPLTIGVVLIVAGAAGMVLFALTADRAMRVMIKDLDSRSPQERVGHFPMPVSVYPILTDHLKYFPASPLRQRFLRHCVAFFACVLLSAVGGWTFEPSLPMRRSREHLSSVAP